MLILIFCEYQVSVNMDSMKVQSTRKYQLFIEILYANIHEHGYFCHIVIYWILE